VKYIQPYDQPSSPDAPYVDLNAPLGIDGSIPPAKFFNVTQEEILNVILAPGFTPSETNHHQLLDAILALMPTPSGAPSDASLVHWGIDSGSINDLIVALPTPRITGVAPGFMINIIPANTVTGPATLEVSLLPEGSVNTHQASIIRLDGTPLGAGDIAANSLATLIYDGLNYRVAYSAVVQSLPKATIIESTTIWAPSSGARRALIFATGGGGSGGGGIFGFNAGGGGPGATAISLLALSGISNVTVTIGQGGAAQTAAAAGNNGGTTSFGTFLIAPGGAGGEFGGNSGLGPGETLPGGTGMFVLRGAPGNPRTGGNQTGNGGSSFWGGGGRYANDRGADVSAGPGKHGGGGGGGANTGVTTGAAGGHGLVFIIEF
jgi:hypothetical protein